MKTKILLLTNEKAMFWTLVLATIFTASMYVFFLNSTVVNVAKRASIQDSISQTNTSMRNLENKYISLKSKINMDLAYSLGYAPIQKATFIEKKSVSVATLTPVQ